jgi:hypothetical protein
MRGLATLTTLAAVAVLVVAALATGAPSQARMTISARPTVLAWAASAQLLGVARGAGPESVVTVEVKECGSSTFREYAEAHVNAGGGWSMDVATAVTSMYRAAWRDARSAPVTIRQRASVTLAGERSGDGFVVAAISKRSLWRKRVEVQRRSGGAWRTVRTVRLADSVRSTGQVSVSEARFRLSVAKGTQLRVRLPLAEARPCYVESVSRVVRA